MTFIKVKRGCVFLKYFYAYLPNKKENVLNSLNLKKNQIFIDDTDADDIEWNALIKKLKESDMLLIPSIESMSSEEVSLKDKLQTLKDIHAQLMTIKNEDLDVDVMLQLMDFIEVSRRNRVRKLQREGIDKALEKKYKGEGRFGRPRIKVPDDFEENIKRIMRKELSHDAYRAQLGMKRSTYYKIVKEVRDSWIKDDKK